LEAVVSCLFDWDGAWAAGGFGVVRLLIVSRDVFNEEAEEADAGFCEELQGAVLRGDLHCCGWFNHTGRVEKECGSELAFAVLEWSTQKVKEGVGAVNRPSSLIRLVPEDEVG
jgi:hypothetical protein